MSLDKVLYTAKTHTTGGRDGASQSDDGRLAVKLSSPGTPGSGTNPEHLFAAGWSACFLSSIRLVAGSDSHPTRRSTPRWTSAPQTALIASPHDSRSSLPGIDRETAQALVDGAHQVYMYSRATRGNVDVTITLV